ncbi:TPA: hypothetical protein HA259_07745, partial [Thermoplasmata archaeon]|nr:hypothetical protein [Thermoplasmata archaeon]
MRRMVVEGRPHSSLMDPLREYFQLVDYVEITDILKLDMEKGVRVCIAKVHMKDGYRFADLNLPEVTRVIKVIKEDESSCTIMAKVTTPAELLALTQKLNLNVIWDVPIIKAIDRFSFACIGEDEELRKMLEAVRDFGEITNVSFQKPTFRNHSPTECLTDKQRDLIRTARKMGYYDYPRRISAKQLAERVGLSQAT